MAPKKPTAPTPTPTPDEPTADVSDALARRGLDRPPGPPLEVDASRLTPRALGPFKGGIILNSRGRCAVCNGAGDHVHSVAQPDGTVTEHTHKGEAAEDDV